MNIKERIALLSPEKRAELLNRLQKQRMEASGGQADGLLRMGRQPREGNAFPLSYTQERLWFLDQFEPDQATYNVPVFLHLRGVLNVVVLEACLNEMVCRHETLRTHFAVRDAQPVQVVLPVEQVKWPTLAVLDLQDLSEQEAQKAARELARDEVRKPFELRSGILWRAKLVQVAAQAHVLIFTAHHLIFDAASTQVFMQEMQALYDAFLHNQPSPLPKLTAQYADFAIWQRKWLQNEERARQLAYWTHHLSDYVPVLNLPIDHARPAVQRFQGGRRPIALSANLTSELKALSQEEGVTLFMTLMAAFNVLLYRYTGQEDMVIGSPNANRNRIETEGILGFFANNLVLRTDLSGQPTFRELLARVRQVALGADAHQDFPFQMLVEALQPERNLSHNPLFQVMFTFSHIEPGKFIPLAAKTSQSIQTSEVSETSEIFGMIEEKLSFIFEEIDNGFAVFDLTLDMMDDGEQLLGAVEYNSDLFDVATVDRLIAHYKRLLQSVVNNREQTIATLPILSKKEEQQLLIEWNDTAGTYEEQLCFHQLVEMQVLKTPNAVALVYDDKEFTYDEFNRKANQLAHHLQTLAIGPEMLVAIGMERSLEMMVALFAILKAGAAFLPLDPTYPKERLAFMLEDSKAVLLLTQARVRKQFASSATRVIEIDREWHNIAQQPDHNPYCDITPDHLAYMIYTSGSTGKPKGVLIAHRGVCSMVEAEARQFDIGPGSRVLQFASLSFDASVFEIAMTLPVGATLCLGSKEAMMSGELLHEQRITVATLPPSLWAALSSQDYPNLQTVFSVGEACTPNVVQEWAPGRRFFNPYGPTETTCYVTIAECVPDGSTPHIGQPILNTEVYILDKQLQPVPVGVPGELHIGAVGMARGYKGRPALTAQTFIPNPFATQPGSRLYKTGDLVRYLPTGNLDFLGRIDHQVKIRGFRVELGEIEAILGQHESVQEAVVLVQGKHTGDKRLIAYLMAAEKTIPDSYTLRRYLSQKLPDYMVPSHFHVLHRFPRTPNGKIDRKPLAAMNSISMEREQHNTIVLPQTDIEQQIAEIWQTQLRVEKVGIHDNFFDLGGYSLLMVQIHQKIQSHFGRKISIVELFRHPTIHLLATHLAQEEEAPATTNVQEEESGRRRGRKVGLREQQARRRAHRGG